VFPVAGDGPTGSAAGHPDRSGGPETPGRGDELAEPAAVAPRIGPDPATPPLHPDLAALAGLLGEWTGTGRGSYPSIEEFDYVETLGFTHTGRAFLCYSQRTSDANDGRPLHMETGYLRPAGTGRVELVVVAPTGIVEVDEGTLGPAGGGGLELRLGSRSIASTSTAKLVTEVERIFTLDAGVLSTRLAMAAVGYPLTHHLASELRRSGPTTDE
jgi:hypothetical protein